MRLLNPTLLVFATVLCLTSLYAQPQSEYARRLAERQQNTDQIQADMRANVAQGNKVASTTPLIDYSDAPPSASEQQAAIQAEMATMSANVRANLNAEASQGGGNQAGANVDMQALMQQHMGASQGLTAGTYDPRIGQEAYNNDTSRRDAFLAGPEGASLRGAKVPAPDPWESWWDYSKSGKFTFDTLIPFLGFLQRVHHTGDLGLPGKYEKYTMPLPIRLHGGGVQLRNITTGETVGPNGRVTLLLNVYPHPDDNGSRVEVRYSTRWVQYRQGLRLWWREANWPWVKSFVGALLSQLGTTDNVEALRADLGVVLGQIQKLEQESQDAQTTLDETARQVLLAKQAADVVAIALETAKTALTAATERQTAAQAAADSAQNASNAANATRNSVVGSYQLHSGRAATLVQQANSLPVPVTPPPPAPGEPPPVAPSGPTRASLLAQAQLEQNAANALFPSMQNAMAAANQASAALSSALQVRYAAESATADASSLVDTRTAQLAAAVANHETNRSLDAEIRYTGGNFASDTAGSVQVDALLAKIASNQSAVGQLQGRAADLTTRINALGASTAERYDTVNAAGTNYIAERSTDANADLFTAALGQSDANLSVGVTQLRGSAESGKQNQAPPRAIASSEPLGSYAYTNTRTDLTVASTVLTQRNPTDVTQFTAVPYLPPLGGGTGRDVQGGGDPNTDTPPQPPPQP